MLRCLVNDGIFEALPGSEGQPTLFRNNKYSACLREDHTNTVRHLVGYVPSVFLSMPA